MASAGAAAPSQSGGSCKDCAQRPPARGLYAARPPRPAALPASRLTVCGPVPGRHALRPHAPRGPQPAVGASPCPAPPHLGPAAAQLPRDPGPCASDVLSAYPQRPGQLRRYPRRCGHPPGPRLLPFFVNLQLPSEPEKLKGRAGAERQRETPPPPCSAPQSPAVGAPPACRAAGDYPGTGRPRPRSPPQPPPPPPRPQPPWSL